ncbi:hypothetical protein JG688_00006716 [Phytophthora aleatoria]|uniref:Ankyrin repeat-containing domain n=1 Tax=Phytophthora aleatoria TaxID=2496075 RepID=A0A8J5J0L4_9STRA|nr:hypothetical protein JG688_00006716 [Phytophthora aleatoria]
MDAAAEGGHVHVAKRLHLNRNRGYTKYAMRVAATLGHLPVVQLLHSYCDKGCVKDAIDCAAKSGHLDIVKWIDVNKLPLRVTSWLHTHFPEQTAVRLNDVPHTLRTGKFELLLFVYAHSPQCINQQFAEDTRDFICRYVFEYWDAKRRILNWLRAKCPSMALCK